MASSLQFGHVLKHENKKDKLLGIFISVLCFLYLLAPTVYGARSARVIYDVTWNGENQAIVELKWNQDTMDLPIMITSWYYESGTLYVSYRTGSSVTKGFDKRTINRTDGVFPCRVVLQNTDNRIDALVDLPEDREKKEAILNLHFRGIIDGYADDSYRPNKTISRGEFTKILCITAGFDINESSENMLLQDVQFQDIEKHWAKKYIKIIARKNIVKGKNATRFDPNGKIKISEVFAIIDRTFFLYATENTKMKSIDHHWSNASFQKMIEHGILRSKDAHYIDYDPNAYVTREECALYLSRVLEQVYGLKSK